MHKFSESLKIKSRDRVLSLFSSRWNWDSPPPHPQASVPRFPGGGGAYSLAGEGSVGSQFRRGGHTLYYYSRYICTLCYSGSSCTMTWTTRWCPAWRSSGPGCPTSGPISLSSAVSRWWTTFLSGDDEIIEEKDIERKAVFRIRIRIHVFLSHPDPLVRGMDPDPSIIMQK